jgi:CBS domain containing-hemolysin-like protein
MNIAWTNLLAAAWPWAILGVMIVTAAFFSGVETGSYRLNRVRLRLAEQEHRPGARLLGKMLADLPGVICVTLLGVNVATYVATIFAERLWQHAYPQAHDELVVEVLTSVTLAPALFIFADLVPKDIFNNGADRLMYPAARPLWVADVFFRGVGLVSLLKGIGRLWVRLARWAGVDVPPEETAPFPPRARLQAILRDSAAEGVMTPYQSELAEKIMNLQHVGIQSAMVPASQAVTISMAAGREDFYKLIRSSSFSRLPVVDPSEGDVLGVLRVHDVLRELGPDDEFDLTLFVRLALDLPDTMNVAQAMFAMQSARLPMGIVRNAKGEFVGLVTLKDLVEEIVGELAAW